MKTSTTAARQSRASAETTEYIANRTDLRQVLTAGYLKTRARNLYQVSAGEGRLASMDGLRGFAVLLVFCVHFDALFGPYALHAPALSNSSRFLGIIGNSGVDVFFVLSGYLIYGAVLGQKRTIAAFLRRRVVRIYPAFLAVFAGYLVLSLLFPEKSKFRGLDLSHSLTYIVQNLLLLPGVLEIKPLITVAWSLSYEFCFYLAVAVLVPVTRMRRWPAATRVAFFAAIIIAYLFWALTASKSFVRALMFIVGILLYEALASRAFRKILNARGEVLSCVLLLVCFAFAWQLDIRSDLFSFFPGWWLGRNAAPEIASYQGPYKTGALIVGVFWFTAYALGFDGRINRLFRWEPIRWLGHMSYSYYLIHGVTLQGVALVWIFLASRGVPRLPLFFGGLVIGFLAAWISSTALFALVEQRYSLGGKTSKGVSSAPVARTVHA